MTHGDRLGDPQRAGRAPPAPTDADISLLNFDDLDQRSLVRLRKSLPVALDRLEKSEAVRSWFGDLFLDVYIKHKPGKMKFLDGKTVEEACQLYEQVY